MPEYDPKNPYGKSSSGVATSSYGSAVSPVSSNRFSDRHSGTGGKSSQWTDKGRENVQRQIDRYQDRQTDEATGKSESGKTSSSVFGSDVGGDNKGSGNFNDTISQLGDNYFKNQQDDLIDFHNEQQKSGWTFFTGKHTIESENEDVVMLYDAAKRMAAALGLDPKKQKDLQVALNYLSGDEWGRQLNLRTDTNAAIIDKIKNENKDGWKTWGTGLRSSAETRYKGNNGLTKADYTKKLNILAGNFTPGTPLYNYQRMLIDANKATRVGVSGLERVFANGLAFLGTGGGALSLAFKGVAAKKGNWNRPETITEKIENPLGLLINENEMDSEKGITSFEYRGNDYTINDVVPTEFSKSKIRDLNIDNKHKDSDDNKYSSSVYHDAIPELTDSLTVDDEEDSDDTTVVVVNSSTTPLWMDWKAFEKVFRIHKGFS